jgi:hypothetical protein
VIGVNAVNGVIGGVKVEAEAEADDIFRIKFAGFERLSSGRGRLRRATRRREVRYIYTLRARRQGKCRVELKADLRGYTRWR